MRQRCGNSRAPKYRRYGARGIRVCDAWQTFEVFEAWALSNGYEPRLTIERINNDGDYCPDNCKWVPPHEQAKNKSNVAMSPDGVPWGQIAVNNGIPRKTYNMRVLKGWPHEQAATKPLDVSKRNKRVW